MRTKCRGCESGRLELIFDFGEVPLAGGFLSGRDAIASERRFPLQVHVCQDCALVQILDAIDPQILFTDYSFSSSTVPPLVDHFRNYASWLAQRFRPTTVVEFGCNDGILLDPLEGLGVRAVGVDVSDNITELARRRGLDVETGFFDGQTATRLVDRIGRADIVSGSNAFAHNDHPEKILEASRAVLAEAGHLCLEVMYAGDLLEQLQWDTLYHEHLTFYSLASLSQLLKRHGFFVTHAERLPMHGGSLRVVAGLKPDVRESAECQAIRAYEQERALDRAETWIDFGRRISRKIEIVRSVFDGLKRERSIWGYGAAGKATMWVNACAMDYLGGMVDASPLRAGKLMPGTHTPIVLPDRFREAAPDFVFITAWNYATGITAKEGWFRGTWAVPLPDLRFF
jgi:SAM-dependent methyltransferase